MVNLSECQYREGTLGLTAGHFSVSDRPLTGPERNKCVPLSKHLSTTLSALLISQMLLPRKYDTDRSRHVLGQSHGHTPAGFGNVPTHTNLYRLCF